LLIAYQQYGLAHDGGEAAEYKHTKTRTIPARDRDGVGEDRRSPRL